MEHSMESFIVDPFLLQKNHPFDFPVYLGDFSLELEKELKDDILQPNSIEPALAHSDPTTGGSVISQTLSSHNSTSWKVNIFEDEELLNRVEPHQKLNKDIIFYFLIQDFPTHLITGNDGKPFSESSFQYNEIIIDDSCFYRGNRKTKQPLIKPSSIKLYGNVHNIDGEELKVCENCVAKKISKMLMVRSAHFLKQKNSEGWDMLVKASVTCSGNPQNSKRPIKVRLKFTIFEFPFAFEATDSLQERVIWNGDSTPFSIFHHRGKRLLEYSKMCNAKKQMTEGIPISPRIKPNIEIPEEISNDLCKATTELMPHLMEVYSADTYSSYFDGYMFHYGIRWVDTFFRTHISFPTSALPNIADFLFTMGGCQDSDWDVDANYNGDLEKLFKRSTFLYEKATSIVVKHFPEVENSLPVSIRHSVFSHFMKMENFYRSFCECSDCSFYHLAFIVKNAIKKGAKKRQIAHDLNYFKVPTKLGKDWHSNLNGLLDRETNHFSWTIYMREGSISEFSKKWYPPSRVQKSLLAYNERYYIIMQYRPILAQYLGIVYADLYPALEEFTKRLADLASLLR